MKHDLSYFNTMRMYYDEEIYKPEVRLDEDGFYRWRYQLDPFHHREMYTRLTKIMALISLIGAIAGFAAARIPMAELRANPHNYQLLYLKWALIYAAGGYLAMFVLSMLIIGLVRLIEGGPSIYWYQMDDEFIQLKPSGKGSGITAFESVKRVELYPEVQEIRLITKFGKTPVLVREEDYDLIKNFILKAAGKNKTEKPAV